MHCRGIDYAPERRWLPPARWWRWGPAWYRATCRRIRPTSTTPMGPRVPFRAGRQPQHRAAIVGDATVRYQQIGTITADEIFAWITPKKPPAAAPPPAAPANRASGWQLERLLARAFQDQASKSRGDVVIVSPQLQGVTRQLEAWSIGRRPWRSQATAAGGARAGPARQAQAAAEFRPAIRRPRRQDRDSPHAQGRAIRRLDRHDRAAGAAARIGAPQAGRKTAVRGRRSAARLRGRYRGHPRQRHRTARPASTRRGSPCGPAASSSRHHRDGEKHQPAVDRRAGQIDDDGRAGHERPADGPAAAARHHSGKARWPFRATRSSFSGP